jgi:hypothetical protein
MKSMFPILVLVRPVRVERKANSGLDEDVLYLRDSVGDELLVRTGGGDKKGGELVRVFFGDEALCSRGSVEKANPVLLTRACDRSPEERKTDLAEGESDTGISRVPLYERLTLQKEREAYSVKVLADSEGVRGPTEGGSVGRRGVRVSRGDVTA